MTKLFSFGLGGAATRRLLLLLLVLMTPELALAQEFSLEKILPESLASKPFIELIALVLGMAILLSIYVMLGFGFSSAIADVFQTLTESRRMGDWGTFFRTLGIVIGVIILVSVIAFLAFDWLINMQLNPKVTLAS